ncbi:MAG: hypothetical protein NTY13_04145 [Chlamydiae bacterium]|nr:hypothetical protein [Chlamydiota bacterium]
MPQRKKWHLQSIVEVRSQRTIAGKVEKSIRYYGSSRKGNADQFMHWVQDHGSIESMHPVMDVVFQQDASLGDSGKAAKEHAPNSQASDKYH